MHDICTSCIVFKSKYTSHGTFSQAGLIFNEMRTQKISISSVNKLSTLSGKYLEKISIFDIG